MIKFYAAILLFAASSVMGSVASTNSALPWLVLALWVTSLAAGHLLNSGVREIREGEPKRKPDIRGPIVPCLALAFCVGCGEPEPESTKGFYAKPTRIENVTFDSPERNTKKIIPNPQGFRFVGPIYLPMPDLTHGPLGITSADAKHHYVGNLIEDTATGKRYIIHARYMITDIGEQTIFDQDRGT